MYINVKHEIGGNSCITIQDGKKIYNLIHDLIIDKQSVTLDFTGIEFFAAPFFNAAIGRLFKDIDINTLHKYVVFSFMSYIGEEILFNVIRNSQKYYSDPIYRKSVDSVMKKLSEDGL